MQPLTQWATRCTSTVTGVALEMSSYCWSFCLLCCLFSLENCSGSQELPKRARIICSSKLSDSVFCFLSALFLTLSLSNTDAHSPKRTQHMCAHTRTHARTHRSARTLADDAVLLYFPTPECLCPVIIVNLIDAVTWPVMGFQVIAAAVWKKHRFFLRRKSASAELGLKKKNYLFLISFSSPLTFLLKCKLLSTSCGRKRDRDGFFFFFSLCKFHLALSHLLLRGKCLSYLACWRLRIPNSAAPQEMDLGYYHHLHVINVVMSIHNSQ